MDDTSCKASSQRSWLRSLFIIVSLLMFCSSAIADNVKTSPGKEIQVTGAEQWKIAGSQYHIDGTMLVKIRPNPIFLYVIRVFVTHDPGKQDKHMARQIARYALVNDYLARAKAIKVSGKPVQLVPDLGVAVVHKIPGLFYSSFKGYKFLFKLSELSKSHIN